MKKLLEIATEKLRSLQHHPPDKKEPILAQLIHHLVFSQESAGDGTELELTVLALMDLSEKALHHFLFGWCTEGEEEEHITKFLEEATTEDEIYEVIIEDLLMTAMVEWKESEPD
ncbi:MAG: hypothetical protein Q7J06_11705 [Bacteroidales bacterium]|nr:hypothetical protein [Bacteroidales bacterium]